MYERILVPIDGSPTARRGLDEAIALARGRDAAIRVLHVIDEPMMALGIDGFGSAPADIQDMMEEAAQRVVDAGVAGARTAGVAADGVIKDSLHGRICDLVAETATEWKADLIVIGTHGRRGLGRLVLGSDAEQILRVAPVPVLLVRGKDDT